MRLSISNGVRKLTADKSEIKALSRACDVLDTYCQLVPADKKAAEALDTQRRVMRELLVDQVFGGQKLDPPEKSEAAE